MNTRPRADESTIPWKPCGVQSRRTVEAGSSMPCPAHVRISGNLAASSGAITSVSTIAKRATSPSGIGSATITGLARAAAVNSRGAAKNCASNAALSSATMRNRSGTIHRSPAGCTSRCATSRQTPPVSAARSGACAHAAPASANCSSASAATNWAAARAARVNPRAMKLSTVLVMDVRSAGRTRHESCRAKGERGKHRSCPPNAMSTGATAQAKRECRFAQAGTLKCKMPCGAAGPSVPVTRQGP